MDEEEVDWYEEDEPDPIEEIVARVKRTLGD